MYPGDKLIRFAKNTGTAALVRASEVEGLQAKQVTWLGDEIYAAVYAERVKTWLGALMTPRSEVV